MLERMIDGGDHLDRLRAYEDLGNLFVGERPEHIRNWALRLSDKLVEAMTADERTEWRKSYGCAA